MVFDGDSNNMDICTLADRPNKTDDTSFPKWLKAMYANMGLREIFREIYAVYGGWQFYDTNLASGSERIATNLLNDGTQFYAFASAESIIGADWIDANGNEFKLEPITLEQIRDMGYAEDEFYDQAGTPEYYRPVKNGIKIYPSSNVAVTNGLLVHVGARDISPFTATATSTTPGYDALAGHEALAEYMSMKYSDENDVSNFPKREAAWLRALAGIKRHYSRKFHELKVTLRKGRTGAGFADQFVS